MGFICHVRGVVMCEVLCCDTVLLSEVMCAVFLLITCLVL